MSERTNKKCTIEIISIIVIITIDLVNSIIILKFVQKIMDRATPSMDF